jgi:AraC family transcriptional regulator of adaptative response/methylated-DNA-[protein]-cysteine methyltransferase
MGLALKSIRSGEKIIDTQLASGYDSSSGFRDAFSRIMGAPLTLLDDSRIFKAAWLDTQLGPMIAISDEIGLFLLEFVDRRGLEREVERLRKRLKAAIIPGQTQPIQSIEQELTQYFEGTLTEFRTPLHFIGTPFQRSVWEQLQQIPPGETRSYADIALALGKPTAYRAVAQANGANQLAIVVPCHRVINTDGKLGGYGGGVARKEWLLNHERSWKSNKMNK